ncbi:uncharacterized protein LOC131439201 [Malaya genurostris]|uniref:uncharacterized protein LOC131439201 n=1 Tax=Malaya genurostris TaxID=325434 RepID=UPI0026F3AA2E|nr:uncharacterized protein LOC131439201 [Malaya genurostris]
MNQYKSKLSSPTASAANMAMTNPFLSPPPTTQSNIVDLFAGGDDSCGGIVDGQHIDPAIKASDDLLQLGNPFADMFGAPQNPVISTSAVTINNMWIGNGSNGTSTVAPSTTVSSNIENTFVSDSNFSSVFGKSDNIGESTQATSTQLSGKVLTGDLDSSLASLAESLSINKGTSAQIKNVQWNSPKNAAKPGSFGWSPQPQLATNQSGYKPMAQGMTVSPAPSTIHPLVHSSYPVVSTIMLQQGIPPIRSSIASSSKVGATQITGGVSLSTCIPSTQQQSQQGILFGPQATIQPHQQQPQQQTLVNANIQLDPFGAL